MGNTRMKKTTEEWNCPRCKGCWHAGGGLCNISSTWRRKLVKRRSIFALTLKKASNVIDKQNVRLDVSRKWKNSSNHRTRSSRRRYNSNHKTVPSYHGMKLKHKTQRNAHKS